MKNQGRADFRVVPFVAQGVTGNWVRFVIFKFCSKRGEVGSFCYFNIFGFYHKEVNSGHGVSTNWDGLEFNTKVTLILSKRVGN
jgi:hypothetical protein